MTDGPWSTNTEEASPWSDIIGADWTSVREFDLGELSAADRAYLIGLVGPMDPLVADLERRLASAQRWAMALEQRLEAVKKDHYDFEGYNGGCRTCEFGEDCGTWTLLSSPLEAS